MHSQLYNDIFYLSAIVGAANQDPELARAIESVLPGGPAYTLPEIQKIIYLFDALELAVSRSTNLRINADLRSLKLRVEFLTRSEPKKIFS